MAVNIITVDQSRRMGGELLNIIAALRENQDRLRQHKELMDNMTDGVTYSAIETQYGVPAGKGDELYNLVAGASAELAADSNLTNLLDWIVPTV